MTATGRDGETVLVADRVVTPEAVLDPGTVVVRDERIAAVHPGTPSAAPDARGELLLPGFVDLHGDDLESRLFPRADARADADTAVLACDRSNVAAGITTKFHAVAFEETPNENRSLDVADDLAAALSDAESLLADHRLHARCEVGNESCVGAVLDVMGREGIDLVSVMNHVPGEGQFDERGSFQRRYPGSDSATATRRVVERRDLPPSAHARRVRRVVERAGATGAVVASHDDDAPETVDWLADVGVAISEFPLSLPTARRARERGLVTAVGAPNLVRGGSLWGNLDVREAVDAGLADVLCTDYRPYSLLESVFVATGDPLHERVARVSAAPAAAVGLDDRGRVEPGARADLLLARADPTPVVERAFVAGSEVYRTGPTR